MRTSNESYLNMVQNRVLRKSGLILHVREDSPNRVTVKLPKLDYTWYRERTELK